MELIPETRSRLFSYNNSNDERRYLVTFSVLVKDDNIIRVSRNTFKLLTYKFTNYPFGENIAASYSSTTGDPSCIEGLIRLESVELGVFVYLHYATAYVSGGLYSLEEVKAKAADLLKKEIPDELQHCFEQWKTRKQRRIDREVVFDVTSISIVAGFVTSSSPVPLKTRRVAQRCTLNLWRAETSSRWCGVVVRKIGLSSGVVDVT
ncbi:hypothetical protein TNCV_4299261 [Trichonephila clavipes]|nr:hypothetical protein TNCV_4299261 [Trichonephila clavipes]